MNKQKITISNEDDVPYNVILFTYGTQRKKKLAKSLAIRKKENDKVGDVACRKRQTMEDICRAFLITETIAFCNSPEESLRAIMNNSHVEGCEQSDINIVVDNSIYNFFYGILKDDWKNFCIRMIRYGIDKLIDSIDEKKGNTANVLFAEESVKELLATCSLSKANESIKNLQSSSDWGNREYLLNPINNRNRKRGIINNIYKDLIIEYPYLVNHQDAIKNDIGDIYDTFPSKKLSPTDHQECAKIEYLKQNRSKIKLLKP